MLIDTGWNPSIKDYHALAYDGVVSSSMLSDLVPPWGRPRLYRDYWVDFTRERTPVGLDAWRGTLVDACLLEDAVIGPCGDFHALQGLRSSCGRVLAVVPPDVDLRLKGQKEWWKNWKRQAAEQRIEIIGLSTVNGREKRDVKGALRTLEEAQAILELIHNEETPAAGIAKALCTGDSGISQLSHRFTWNGIPCRWRPDRLVEWSPELLELVESDEVGAAGYAHVSLKVTRHAHPGPFWTHYQSGGWGMRDAFYELGWSELVAGETTQADYPFPWPAEELEGAANEDLWDYVDDEPLDWIVIACHHLPTPEVYVHVVPESQRRLGRKRVTFALRLLKHCLDTGKWFLPEEAHAIRGRDPRHYEWEI